MGAVKAEWSVPPVVTAGPRQLTGEGHEEEVEDPCDDDVVVDGDDGGHNDHAPAQTCTE